MLYVYVHVESGRPCEYSRENRTFSCDNVLIFVWSRDIKSNGNRVFFGNISKVHGFANDDDDDDDAKNVIRNWKWHC